MQRVTCPHCGTAIPATHINMQHMKAVCPACDALFPVDADISTKDESSDHQPLQNSPTNQPSNKAAFTPVERKNKPKTQPRKIHCPGTLTVKDTDDGFVILTPAYNMSEIEKAGIPFVVALALMGGVLTIALLTGAIEPRFFGVFTMFVPLGGIWYLLQKAANTITVGISSDWIFYEQKPFALFNHRRFATRSVIDIQAYPLGHMKNRGLVAHTPDMDVYIQISDGEWYALRRNMERQAALFIAQELRAELARQTANGHDWSDDEFFEADALTPLVDDFSAHHKHGTG